MGTIRKWLGIAIASSLAACAGVARPTDEISQDEAAMRSAKELGAEGVPQAMLQLKLAQEELDKANAYIKDGDNEKAQQMVSRSRADAELAIALTRQNQAQSDARAAQDQLKSVPKVQ